MEKTKNLVGIMEALAADPTELRGVCQQIDDESGPLCGGLECEECPFNDVANAAETAQELRTLLTAQEETKRVAPSLPEDIDKSFQRIDEQIDKAQRTVDDIMGEVDRHQKQVETAVDETIDTVNEVVDTAKTVTGVFGRMFGWFGRKGGK